MDKGLVGVDAHSLDRLEFGKVLERIAALAMMSLGADAARALRPSPDADAARTRSERIADGVAILADEKDFPVERFDDPSDLLDRAAVEDAFLSPPELQTVATILRNAEDFQKTFRRLRDRGPTLWKLTQDLVPQPELRREIEEKIELDGTVADDASPELRRLRHQMHQLEDRIRARLERMVQNADLKPYLTGDYITQRSGRSVIPVAAVQAGQVRGIIHDRSDSGATVFLEPEGVVPLGNELRALAADEGREVRRILRELTALVREDLFGLRQTVRTLVELDVVRACARYARRLRMVRPEFSEDGRLEVRQGRHPILEETLGQSGSDVVPLDFRLNADLRTVAITGANAGGKTVSLKTIGLLSLMAHAGLLVPAEEGTTFPRLSTLLVDIGDEQSIEANLSTFSGHMSHIRDILRRAGEGTLVLLDEIGAGTDPVEGGALACAVLAALHGRGAMTVVTTHLSQVKGFVHEQAGMENAAVAFDPDTLEPTYRLLQGQPGASHALTIARRLGLPEDVLTSAEGLVDSGAIEMEGLLARLTASLKRAEADASTARRRREEAEAAQKELAKRLEDVKRERKEALRKAAEEARGLVENTRREMQQALEEARRAGASGAESTKHLRRKVETRRDALKQKSRELAPRTRARIPLDQLEEGQRVWVGPMKRHGTVSRIDRRGGKVTVDAGGLEVEVDASGLAEPDSRDQERSAEAESKEGRTVVEPAGPVSPELHLRGQRYEEARRNLESYLHRAYLAGLGSVRIVHGHGTGTLARMVQEFLEDYPLVERFRFGERGEGGRGVTVATLR
jgi:DNA mismatch repair protein MutS2